MGEVRNAYKIHVGKPERIIQDWILEKQGAKF
jgi:hypothetical protein